MNLTKATAVRGIRKNKAGQVVAFSINRKVWGRGGRGGSLLETEVLENLEGEDTTQINMCCLGVYGRACGISVKRLKGQGMLSSVSGRRPKQIEWTLNESGGYSDIASDIAEDLAAINDNSVTSDESKEEKIIAKFAAQGIRVKFVGKG